MPRKPGTVREKLADPASWPSRPDDFAPPNDNYLLARLASVSCSGKEVIVVVKSGEGLYQSTFEMDSESEAGRIVFVLQPGVGDLLLEAIDAKLCSSENTGMLLRCLRLQNLNVFIEHQFPSIFVKPIMNQQVTFTANFYGYTRQANKKFF